MPPGSGSVPARAATDANAAGTLQNEAAPTAPGADVASGQSTTPDPSQTAGAGPGANAASLQPDGFAAATHTGRLRYWDDVHGFGFAALSDGAEVYVPVTCLGNGFKPGADVGVMVRVVKDNSLALLFRTTLRAELCYSATGEVHWSDDDVDDQAVLEACLRAEAGAAADDDVDDQAMFEACRRAEADAAADI